MAKEGKRNARETKGRGNLRVTGAGSAKENKKNQSGALIPRGATNDSKIGKAYEAHEKHTGSYVAVKPSSLYYGEAVLVHATKKPESHMTTIEKMDASNKGISKKDLEGLKEKAGLDYDQLVHILDVSRTTLIGKKSNEIFATGLSEKIMSLADIYSYGYEVFGDENEFNQWIFQPIPALGGKSPYEILNNHYGRQEVRNIIGRIEYGVYS